MGKLQCVEQPAIMKFWGIGQQRSVITTLPYAYTRYAFIQSVRIKNIGGTDRTEIAFGRVVRALAIVNRRD